jgi:hypothetical protein
MDTSEVAHMGKSRSSEFLIVFLFFSGLSEMIQFHLTEYLELVLCEVRVCVNESVVSLSCLVSSRCCLSSCPAPGRGVLA